MVAGRIRREVIRNSQSAMLKISQSNKVSRCLTLQLEGRLVGPWVVELRQTCEPLLADETKFALDLSEVSFADESGVMLLTNLNRRGVKLLRPTPFVSEQLKATAGAQLK